MDSHVRQCKLTIIVVPRDLLERLELIVALHDAECFQLPGTQRRRLALDLSLHQSVPVVA
jgi:hypothetical protein